MTGWIIGEIIEAAENSDPLLVDKRRRFIRSTGLDKLVASYNRIVTESARISGTGQEYHEQILTLLGNLREAVVIVDNESRIVSANTAFEEMVETTSPVAGKRLDAFMQGSSFREFLQEIRRGQTGRYKEIEVQVQQSPHWLEVSAAPLKESGASGAQYTLFVFHNITRQKKLEKMRTEFVANVSHELRTPVTIIKGFAETLIDDEDVLTPDERSRFLKKIHNNSERLHSLLQDLLLLSRLESTEAVLRKETFKLSEFLSDVADNWKSVLADKEQQLVLDFEATDDRIHADPLRLSQVVINLLENALRHASGFTELRLRTLSADGGIRIIVEDNGNGIPEEDLPHIFQRFYRVEKGRSRESGGTGLGLAIVKHIVQQHGGEIQAYSRKGQGTRIEILLPLPKQEARPGTNSNPA